MSLNFQVINYFLKKTESLDEKRFGLASLLDIKVLITGYNLSYSHTGVHCKIYCLSRITWLIEIVNYDDL